MLFESTTSHLAVSTAKPTHFLPVESGCRASAPLDITPRELRLWCRATTALSAVFSNSSPPFLGKRRFVPANWVFKPPPFQRPRLAESAKAFVSRSTQLSLCLSLSVYVCISRLGEEIHERGCKSGAGRRAFSRRCFYDQRVSPNEADRPTYFWLFLG